MTTTASLDQASQPLQLRNFYLARQPMLDRNQALFAYELLFRNTPNNSADIESGLSGAIQVDRGFDLGFQGVALDERLTFGHHQLRKIIGRKGGHYRRVAGKQKHEG